MLTRSILLFLVLLPACFPANLAVSTYFKDGFTPSAAAVDTQGNLVIVGTAVTDAVTQTTGAAVIKLDPKGSEYLFLTFLDSAASDAATAVTTDSDGNVYVAGWTSNPNFVIEGGGNLATPPPGGGERRSFVAKLSPRGAILFSVLLGGNVASQARGVAVTPQGNILVSGLAEQSGFPVTNGAFSVAETKDAWYLLEVDPSASKLLFSATGIGGSSIVLDAADNIFLAGSSSGITYPTTPGAYQPQLAQGYPCYGSFCTILLPGRLQHVTKVDATASKLIYSTGLNDLEGNAGDTINNGLAVDSDGNAYVTGTIYGSYPLTVPAPVRYSGFLSKLDPTGSSLLFSLPVGGGGVQLDSLGAVYVAGTVTDYQEGPGLGTVTPQAPPDPLTWLPRPCRPDNIVTRSGAYVMKLDSADGTPADAQWIGGSAPGAAGIVAANGRIWITGSATAIDVPLTTGTVSPANLGTGFVSGAYLAAIDFAPSAPAPEIACVLDSANLAHVREVAPYQLISLFGRRLGPPDGVAPDGGTSDSVAGVSITFDGKAAQLLYVSDSQVNVAVPVPDGSANGLWPSFTDMEINVNGVKARRRLPFARNNLNMFGDLSAPVTQCVSGRPHSDFRALALNADGGLNSCDHPAGYGQTISFFVHGAGAFQFGAPPLSTILGLQAFAGQCSASVEAVTPINAFVYQVHVRMPASVAACASSTTGVQIFHVALSYQNVPVGPLYLDGTAGHLAVWLQ